MARRFEQRGPQRQFIWSGILLQAAGAALASGKSTGGLGALGVTSGGGVTLIRTRGMYNVHFDPTSVNDVVQFAMGLALFSSDAFTAGAASLPGPISDLDYDWIWHQNILLGPTFTATEGTADLMQNTGYRELDSKAMRKLKPSESMGFVVEAAILSGGGTIDFSMSARQLFKLG